MYDVKLALSTLADSVVVKYSVMTDDSVIEEVAGRTGDCDDLVGEFSVVAVTVGELLEPVPFASVVVSATIDV